MKILSFFNVSNIDDIESDSGYIFNHLLYTSFIKNGFDFRIILPTGLENKTLRFDSSHIYHAEMGETKYTARYYFSFERIRNIILDYKPDVIFVNQCELTATFKAMLLECGIEKNTKIITYCHYPALHLDANDDTIMDYTLNDGGLCQSILSNIFSAVNIADAFVIQSEFAKGILQNFAEKHNIVLKDIAVYPPPYDTDFYMEEMSEKNSASILYNHRLYDSYGTKEFISFVKNNPDLQFIVSDPMANRSNKRKRSNSTPEENREILKAFNNVTLKPGGNRVEYSNNIDMSRLAVAPYRKACVWSMSVIDCYCRFVPVIGPDISALRELIPANLLFTSEEQERELAVRLVNDDDFWYESVKKSREILKNISPDIIAKNIISLI